MLHPFHVVVDHALLEAEQLQEIGQEVMPLGNVPREGFAGGGEDKAAVLFVFEQSLGVETLDHVGDAGLGDAKAGRDVDDPRVALGVNQFEDALEVIFHRGGIASGDGFGSGRQASR